MKPTTEELILQIVSTCLLITTQGKWHAFAHLYGHTGSISVTLCPADTDYQTLPHVQHDKSGHWTYTKAHGLKEDEKERRATNELQEVLQFAQGFLDLAQEAAA